MNNIDLYKHRITQRKKNANDFEWYKHQLDLLDAGSFTNLAGFGGIPEQRRMQANYDLYNNIIDPKEFEYICRPYGDAVGELPATFSNRDITSGKIKVLLGMETKRPFSWKVFAVNEEATTRKEQEEFARIKEYVISQTMQPIMQQIQMQKMQEMQGRQLTPEEETQLQQQIQQELQAATPQEVKRYMEREHQDPAEVLAHQILEYLIEKLNIKDVFNDGWKHGLLSGIEVYWEGRGIDEPMLTAVNPLNFDYDRSPDLKYIEDGEWACAVYEMTPSKIVEFFGNELTDEEIDEIYQYAYKSGDSAADATFTFRESRMNSVNTVRVFHGNFKSLRKIGFLSYIDPDTGMMEEMVVNENYKLDPVNGDIAIDWQWIPEAHEGYKIGSDTYKRMRPIPGQHRDPDNLHICKLSYKGAAYDNMNSEVTSLMDRMKPYQFYYNIIMYRIEMLMASDKGKILLLNMNMIPKSLGVNINKLMYYMDATKIGFLNPNEEGNRNATSDIVNAAKEIDMSLISNLKVYIELAEYIEQRCGNSVGITKAMEGQTPPQESVGNNQLNYTQASFIIEPYFDLHYNIKKNTLQSLIETAKSCYVDTDKRKLSYVLDDLSMRMLDIDVELLDNSVYGFFVANSSKAWEAKEAVKNLSQAAMQNQKAELSDIVKIIRSESIQEAEELLAVAETTAHERAMSIENNKLQAMEASKEKEREFERERWEHEKELIVIKEEERRETEIQKQVIFSMGFNEDKDLDKDGVPDVLEVAKQGVDANIKMRKQLLDEQKFSHQKEKDKQDVDIKKAELEVKKKAATRKVK